MVQNQRVDLQWVEEEVIEDFHEGRQGNAVAPWDEVVLEVEEEWE